MRYHNRIWLAAPLALTWLIVPAKAHVAAQAAAWGTVLVNGNVVPKAKSAVEIQKEVREFREGGGGGTRLLPGEVEYRVCIESPALIPVIEAACAPEAPNPYLDVTVEDGRSFTRCLVESSSTSNQHTARGWKRYPVLRALRRTELIDRRSNLLVTAAGHVVK
jgi:hypothetical protein